MSSSTLYDLAPIPVKRHFLGMASIEAKHRYRFDYLKSEHWSNLRIEKLAQCDAKCARCGYRNLSNDVHHLRYRKLYDVTVADLVVLCRDCHEAVHESLNETREALEEGGAESWITWLRFIELWGEKPSRIPELWGVMRDMRHAGLIPKLKQRQAANRELQSCK